jgi:hypothetical protein
MARLPCEVVAVLQRHGDPEQGAVVSPSKPRLGLLGLGERPLRQHDPEAVEQRVDALDALQGRLDQLGGRQLA